MARNRFGLSRHVPVAVKKVIRRRCGFGCVICGQAIVTYEHIEPRFKDAKEHDPSKMTLLCGSHQEESKKRLLSAATLFEADQNPCAKRRGYADHVFDLGGDIPLLSLGSNLLRPMNDFLIVRGRPVWTISRPDKYSSKWRLTGEFYDRNGDFACSIEENELQLLVENADTIQEGQKFTIRGRTDDTVLQFRVEPPNLLSIERLDMLFPEDGRIQISGGELNFIALSGEVAKLQRNMLTNSALKISKGHFAIG